MKKILMLAVPMLAMACGDIMIVDGGTAKPTAPVATSASQKIILSYVCPGYQNYSGYMDSPTADILKTDFGGNQTLVRTRAASGELFSNGSYEIHSKGNEALLTDSSGNTIACQIVR